jgi:hypothetical protein
MGLNNELVKLEVHRLSSVKLPRETRQTFRADRLCHEQFSSEAGSD